MIDKSTGEYSNGIGFDFTRVYDMIYVYLKNRLVYHSHQLIHWVEFGLVLSVVTCRLIHLYQNIVDPRLIINSRGNRRLNFLTILKISIVRNFSYCFELLLKMMHIIRQRRECCQYLFVQVRIDLDHHPKVE